jgi:hypothetical protein
MVKTRAEIKVKISEWIGTQKDPFTTRDVIQENVKHITLQPMRIKNYIQSTEKADFNKTKKVWEPRITPIRENAS